MIPPDISEHARIAYAAGIDPLDYAEAEVGHLLKAHITAALTLLGEGVRPGPGLSLDAMVRRILGSLLAAGWVPPGGLEVPGEVPDE